MSEQNTQSVVVTDIRMPFWSMVVFMIKWAVAAIPAIIILAVIGSLVAAVLGGAFSFIQRSSADNKAQSNYEQQNEEVKGATITQSTAKPTGNFEGVPDRCKGNPDQDKCIEEERRLASESPEQRALRIEALEALRKANMAKIK